MFVPAADTSVYGDDAHPDKLTPKSSAHPPARRLATRWVMLAKGCDLHQRDRLSRSAEGHYDRADRLPDSYGWGAMAGVEMRA